MCGNEPTVQRNRSRRIRSSVRTIPIDLGRDGAGAQGVEVKMSAQRPMFFRHGQASLQDYNGIRDAASTRCEGCETHRQGWRAEIYARMLRHFVGWCINPERQRRPRAAAQAGAIPARALHHIHDVRHLRPPVPQQKATATELAATARQLLLKCPAAARPSSASAKLDSAGRASPATRVRLRNAAAMSQSANQPSRCESNSPDPWRSDNGGARRCEATWP